MMCVHMKIYINKINYTIFYIYSNKILIMILNFYITDQGSITSNPRKRKRKEYFDEEECGKIYNSSSSSNDIDKSSTTSSNETSPMTSVDFGSLLIRYNEDHKSVCILSVYSKNPSCQWKTNGNKLFCKLKDLNSIYVKSLSQTILSVCMSISNEDDETNKHNHIHTFPAYDSETSSDFCLDNFKNDMSNLKDDCIVTFWEVRTVNLKKYDETQEPVRHQQRDSFTTLLNAVVPPPS